MTTLIQHDGNTFYRALVGVAMVTPMLLVVAAGALPEGLARGDLIVRGHGVALILVATALIVRAVYAYGFRQALRMSGATENYSVVGMR